MSRQRSYKNALLLSILSILLCIVMLVGTTLAWFADPLSGNIYADCQGTGYVAQNIYLEEYVIDSPIRTFTIKADLNKTSVTGYGMIKLDFYKKVVNDQTGEESYSHLEAYEIKFCEENVTDGWEQIQAEFTMPDNTAMCALNVRV